MKDFWLKNLETLAQSRPELFNLINEHDYTAVGQLVKNSAGDINLLYNGKHDKQMWAYGSSPWDEAADHLQTIAPEATSLIIFIGMGLGYAPLLLLRERPYIGKLVIIEPSMDLFCTALHAIDLRPLLDSPIVSFYIGEINLVEFELDVARLAALEDTHFLRHMGSINWHKEPYVAVNDQVYRLINQLNASGGTTNRCGAAFFKNRLKNLTLLRHVSKLDNLKDLCKDKPAVLVAAGPSLDQSLNELKKVADNCLIIAADSALAPLLQVGITPDFVTSIDFQEANFEKLAPFMGCEWPFSLVTQMKITPLIPKRFPARYLFWAFNEDLPQDWIKQTLGVKNLLESGFSVAHLSLGLAIHLGADPIVFIGQDLSYTAQDADHAAGTVFVGHGFPADREILHAKAISGGMVATDRQFLALQKDFEDIIAAYPRTYLNATAAGVDISGTQTISFAEVSETYLHTFQNISNSVEEAVKAGKAFPVASFVKKCRKTLRHIVAAKKQLTKVAKLHDAILSQLDEVGDMHCFVNDVSELPPKLHRKLADFDKVNNKLDSQSEFWNQLIELTYRSLRENELWLNKNMRLREREGYLVWLRDELARISFTNQVRREAAEEYQRGLSVLINHLDEEGKLQHQLAVGQEGALKNLAQLYLESGDLKKCHDLIYSDEYSYSSDDEEITLIRAEVAAGLLNFSQAKEYWHHMQDNSKEKQEVIKNAREKYAAEWLRCAENKGENYPLLLAVWLERIGKLIIDDKKLGTFLQDLWNYYEAKIKQLLQAEKIKEAHDLLVGWESLETRLPEVSYWRARCAAAANDQSQALQLIENILARFPANPHWLAFNARLLLESGSFIEGVDLLHQAVALDPNQAIMWEELGDILVLKGDHDGALAAYENCFIALPENFTVLNKMGDCYLEKMLIDAAKAAYNAVLQKNQDNQWAKNGLIKADKLKKTKVTCILADTITE